MFASCEAERDSAGASKPKPARRPPPVAPFGLHALWKAYRACRKGKRKARDTQAYEARLLDKLVSSRDALANAGLPGAWRPSRTFSFVVSRPKLREIHAAPFADRVVHHVLVDRLARAVRSHTLVPDEARALQSHCRAMLAADPTQGVRRRGAPKLFAQVPPHKRLGALGPGVGLPIGNLTSQFFANVYLNELDQFVKHRLKARWYVRFVDDFVLLHPDPAQLLAWRGQIAEFLAQRLSLQLKNLVEPHPLQQGTDFLGYVIRPFYRLARRRVVQRMHTCLRAFARTHVRPHALALPLPACEALRAQLNSYVGHLRHANSQRLWQRTLAQFPWLLHLFRPPQGPTQARPQLGAPRWAPCVVTGLASQHRYFAALHPGACVLLQVGKHCLLTDVPPGLPPPSVHTHRPGLGLCSEWPLQALPLLRQRLQAQGRAYVVVRQTGHMRSGFKQRTLTLVWYPAMAEAPVFLSTPDPT